MDDQQSPNAQVAPREVVTGPGRDVGVIPPPTWTDNSVVAARMYRGEKNISGAPIYDEDGNHIRGIDSLVAGMKIQVYCRGGRHNTTVESVDGNNAVAANLNSIRIVFNEEAGIWYNIPIMTVGGAILNSTEILKCSFDWPPLTKRTTPVLGEQPGVLSGSPFTCPTLEDGKVYFDFEHSIDLQYATTMGLKVHPQQTIQIDSVDATQTPAEVERQRHKEGGTEFKFVTAMDLIYVSLDADGKGIGDECIRQGATGIWDPKGKRVAFRRVDLLHDIWMHPVYDDEIIFHSRSKWKIEEAF